MKKVLSAVLATALVASMGASAFAAGIADFTQGTAATDPENAMPDILMHNGAKMNLGTLIFQDTDDISYNLCQDTGCVDMIVALSDNAVNYSGIDANGDKQYTAAEVQAWLDANPDVAPADILVEIEANATAGYYAKISGTEFVKHNLLTYQQIKDADLDLEATIVEDTGAVIKSVSLDKKNASVDIKFASRLVSTDTEDFEIDLNLCDDYEAFMEATVYGSIKNATVEANAKTKKLDISNGLVVVPTDFVESIELYVGEGVTVHTKLWEGKKYYCVADRDADDADQRVMEEYADVDNVVTLYRVGVNNSGDYVTFSNDYAEYFVYGYEDGALQFLGMGDEEIAAYGDNAEAYTKYYFANKELVLDNADADVDAEVEAPTASNNNANPGTGR